MARLLKLILIAIFFFLLYVKFSYSQKKIRIGFNAGPTLSGAEFTNISTIPNNFDMIPNLGFFFGIISTYEIKENFSFETGINFVGKGVSYSFPDGRSSSLSVSPEIPILLGIKTKLNEKTFIKAYIGGAANFQVESWGTGIAGDTLSGNYLLQDSTHYLGGTSFLLITGLGFEKELKKSLRIFLGLSYHHGFNRMLKGEIIYYNAGKTYVNSFESKGSYISLDLRFLFGKK